MFLTARGLNGITEPQQAILLGEKTGQNTVYSHPRRRRGSKSGR